MTSPDNEVSAALRQLRRDAGLTQTQLAMEIGIAPTSIYRYEAGTRPDPLSLLILTRYAQGKGLTAARNVFLEALGPMAQLLSGEPLTLAQTTDIKADDEISPVLEKALRRLTSSEKIEVLAFLSFVKENKDSTRQAVIEFLLKPWRDRMREQLNAPATVKERPAREDRRLGSRRKSRLEKL
jgi:transcriptional regulator with XRE-family HTH domain